MKHRRPMKQKFLSALAAALILSGGLAAA